MCWPRGGTARMFRLFSSSKKGTYLHEARTASQASRMGSCDWHNTPDEENLEHAYSSFEAKNPCPILQAYDRRAATARLSLQAWMACSKNSLCSQWAQCAHVKSIGGLFAENPEIERILNLLIQNLKPFATQYLDKHPVEEDST